MTYWFLTDQHKPCIPALPGAHIWLHLPVSHAVRQSCMIVLAYEMWVAVMCFISRQTHKTLPHRIIRLCNLPLLCRHSPGRTWKLRVKDNRALISSDPWIMENPWQPHQPLYLSNIVRWAKNKLVPYLSNYIFVAFFIIAAILPTKYCSHLFLFLLPLPYLPTVLSPWNSPTYTLN